MACRLECLFYEDLTAFGGASGSVLTAAVEVGALIPVPYPFKQGAGLKVSAETFTVHELCFRTKFASMTAGRGAPIA